MTQWGGGGEISRAANVHVVQLAHLHMHVIEQLLVLFVCCAVHFEPNTTLESSEQ